MVISDKSQSFSIYGENQTGYDIPTNNEEINWYPKWSAFYWMTRGRLVLKIDTQYSKRQEQDDACNTPLFSFSDSLVHKIYETEQAGDKRATFIDHVMLYNFMYFAIQGDGWKIYKASGTPTNLRLQLVIDLQEQQRLHPNLNHLSMGPVKSMNSLYNYCFYVRTQNNDGILWQWRPYLHVDGEGLAVKDENGDYIEDTSLIEASALMIEDRNGQTMQKLY